MKESDKKIHVADAAVKVEEQKNHGTEKNAVQSEKGKRSADAAAKESGKKNHRILILGGDARSHYLAGALRKALLEEREAGRISILETGNPLSELLLTPEQVLAELERCSILVLPVPYSTDGIHVNGGTPGTVPVLLSSVLEALREGQTVFGGCLKADFIRQLQERKVAVTDFMKRKGFAENNALPTAEGAIAEAVLSMPGTLEGSACLVIGPGICGKAIAEKLKAMSACVTIMARREEARLESIRKGWKAVPMFSELTELPDAYDAVFNTVPDLVLDRSALLKLGRDTVIIDIASAPGGTDFEACQELGIPAKLCLGLPGKYAPRRSGEILAEQVMEVLD